ncbi:TATA box-binding protein-associated factor RNA polymerase I subunit B [Oryzias latipes]|uniref:TATA box-binding protein-associated factor RNA polymerase I subunit B n=1 Tax=Oryzias latipes TaxID=8090 RepID=H2MV46_ORYLA|nr:TATA box-binding protein-associated factor RNA polymerase I subunit B [Oryzias latipes]
MDEEETAGYAEPCAQCAAVDWGLSEEGRFFCKSCHNVIERTKEVMDLTFIQGANRISTLGRKSKTETAGGRHTWMVCEGFQFILMNQADALLRLGVHPHFKDGVLRQLWRLYLQKSRQAYCVNRVRSAKFRVGDADSDSDSAAEASVASASGTDGESNPCSSPSSKGGSDWSGSADSLCYLTPRQRRSHRLLSLKKTLALIHLALVWSREALTLSDLLGLVNCGSVPYVKAHEQLPEQMKLFGKDALLFTAETVPSHRSLHKEAQDLLLFLQLPAFPPISQQTLLHPGPLSLRYLIDANLPGELHRWVCRVAELAGLFHESRQTFHPESQPTLPRYDLQAAALIIVTMKLLFGLDDHTEWELSNNARSTDGEGAQFNLRRWYKLMQTALNRAQQRRDQDTARRQWRAKKPIFMRKKEKWWIMKKKRVAEQLQICFEKLSSQPSGPKDVTTSSFKFCWGEQKGADGPSLHHTLLDGVVGLKDDLLTPHHHSYWHSSLRPCKPRCQNHFTDLKNTLPNSFVWLLELFCFILDVKPSCLYEEVLSVERRVFAPPTDRARLRNRTETRTRHSAQTSEES